MMLPLVIRRRFGVAAFAGLAMVLAGALLVAESYVYVVRGAHLPSTELAPRVIDLGLPDPHRRIGGLVTVDLNGDGRRDFIVTGVGYIAAFSLAEGRLWKQDVDIQVTSQAERDGLPGLHAPGVQAADIDGSGAVEVLFLTRSGELHILDGASGATRRTVRLPVPDGAERWEHLVVADFRGLGDRDLLLQATNKDGYRMGRYLAAYPVDRLLRDGSADPLWERDDFLALAHNGARVADLNRDGRDMVLGGDIIGPDGERLFRVPLQAEHLDALHVANVRPDLPGLEVVALEEGGKERVLVYNHEGLIWAADHERQEPQNAIIGNFDPDRPGLEIWNRSRYDRNQRPFVFDSRGELIADYRMADVAPKGWTVSGVEVIYTIDWTGEPKQLAAAKERHRAGDVAIFDPLSGEFLLRINERADRLYVADVTGDWREELIVLSGGELRIYENPEPNPNPDRPRLWDQDHYQRSKMTWNYYSP